MHCHGHYNVHHHGIFPPPSQTNYNFSGLGRGLSNLGNSIFWSSFTNSMILGGFSLLSSIFSSPAIFRGAGSGSYGSYGSDGSNPAPTSRRSTSDILKDLRGYASLSKMSGSVGEIKAKANRDKESAQVANDNAKNKPIMKDDNTQYTYETYIKDLNVSPETKDFLLGLFNSKLSTNLTAGELKEIVDRVKDEPHCSDLKEEMLYDKAGTGSKEMVQNVRITGDQLQAAESAAAKAETLSDNTDINKEISALKIEYAEAKTKMSKGQIDALASENNSIQAKIDKLSGKKKPDKAKINDLVDRKRENQSKIDTFNQALAEAETEMNKQLNTVAVPQGTLNPAAAKPEAEVKPEAKTEVKSETEVKPEAKTEVKSETEVKPEAEVKQKDGTNPSAGKVKQKENPPADKGKQKETPAAQTSTKKDGVYVDANGKPLQTPTDEVLKAEGMTPVDPLKPTKFTKDGKEYIFRNGKFFEAGGSVPIKVKRTEDGKLYSKTYQFYDGTKQVDKYDYKGNLKTRQIYDKNNPDKLIAANIFYKGKYVQYKYQDDKFVIDESALDKSQWTIDDQGNAHSNDGKAVFFKVHTWSEINTMKPWG